MSQMSVRYCLQAVVLQTTSRFRTVTHSSVISGVRECTSHELSLAGLQHHTQLFEPAHGVTHAQLWLRRRPEAGVPSALGHTRRQVTGLDPRLVVAIRQARTWTREGAPPQRHVWNVQLRPASWTACFSPATNAVASARLRAYSRYKRQLHLCAQCVR